MLKGWATVLGLGLVLLGIAEVNTIGALHWLAWYEFALALGSFVIAAMIKPTHPKNYKVSSPFTLSLLLLVGWLVGLSTGTVPSGFLWWNFLFACAYGFLGASLYYQKEPVPQKEVHPHSQDNSQDHPRKAA